MIASTPLMSGLHLSLDQHLLAEPGQPRPPAALGVDHAAELLVGPVDLVVDDHVVEDAVLLDLALGVVEAAPRRLLVLGPAPAEPPLQLREGRGEDEHPDRAGDRRLDL